MRLEEDGAVQVYPLRLSDAPGEIWYGVKHRGRDLQAGWADPDAARRAGERYELEFLERTGGTVTETETPDQQTIPETPEEAPPAEPETAPQTEENGDNGED